MTTIEAFSWLGGVEVTNRAAGTPTPRGQCPGQIRICLLFCFVVVTSSFYFIIQTPLFVMKSAISFVMIFHLEYIKYYKCFTNYKGNKNYT